MYSSCECFRSEVNSEPRETYKMDLFAKIFSGFSQLIVFVKTSIPDVWLGSEYLSADSKTIVDFLKKLTYLLITFLLKPSQNR